MAQEVGCPCHIILLGMAPYNISSEILCRKIDHIECRQITFFVPSIQDNRALWMTHIIRHLQEKISDALRRIGSFNEFLRDLFVCFYYFCGTFYRRIFLCLINQPPYAALYWVDRNIQRIILVGFSFLAWGAEWRRHFRCDQRYISWTESLLDFFNHDFEFTNAKVLLKRVSYKDYPVLVSAAEIIFNKIGLPPWYTRHQTDDVLRDICALQYVPFFFSCNHAFMFWSLSWKKGPVKHAIRPLSIW